MKVSIIGAGRNRNGIGEYIGKYFHKNRAEVSSVLGRTEETSRKASMNLEKYGIKSNAYTDLHEMVERERPDLVVIASPSSTHYDYLVKCIDLGLHIFCEKPFLSPDLDDVKGRVENILQKAKEKRSTVAMNSEWPFRLACQSKTPRRNNSHIPAQASAPFPCRLRSRPVACLAQRHGILRVAQK